MMGRSSGKGVRLELKLNLSPPRASLSGADTDSSTPRSSTSSSAPSSPPSSCVSSEPELHYSSSPEPATASMVLAGCPRCLMYVMLSEDDPRCPRCGSAVLLDFLGESRNEAEAGRRSGRRSRRSRV